MRRLREAREKTGVKGWVKPWRGYNLAVKKNWRRDGREAPIVLVEGLFSFRQVPVKQFVIICGPQSRICEIGMEVKFDEKYFKILETVQR